ncbi:MAG: Uma2 family endonuclease [Planctomycetes bacterium]|jgi:Uma2 family endonuclease|nr:Uma2 family endonuclease [Planctomycetota bacterium]
MSTVTSTMPQTAAGPPSAVPNPVRADVVVENRIIVPGWVNTLAEYRRWAETDDYPQTGWVSYLDGKIWVDPNLEEFFTHNRVKQAFNYMFGSLFEREPVADFVPDRMLLVNTIANLSTEPDGLFYLWDTMRSGRLGLVPGKKTGYMQLEGTPDGVLEIVSDGSVTKDLDHLRNLYWKAQFPEYWVVDARGDAIRFDIFRHAEEGYEPTLAQDGWLRSEVLGHSFRVERKSDPLGRPKFVVHVKP